MKYHIILKSGVTLEGTSKNATKNIIGLWNWCLRQMTPQTIDFCEFSILASEISVMMPLELTQESNMGEIGYEDI